MENWKDIKGYEGLYQVSDLGRVRSLDRKVSHASGCLRLLKGRIMKPTMGDNGYYTNSLNKHGKKKTFAVHKLVAINFLNHEPCGYNLVIDHINNEKTDNRLSNIQIVTNRQNVSKGKTQGTSKYTGVSWYANQKKWAARMRLNGSDVFLGYFKDELSASQAYQQKLKSIK